MLSTIITAHNEGSEVRRTVRSVRRCTRMPVEIIVVDDGSSDGSCLDLGQDVDRVIRHDRRVGVAYSRAAGCAAARGDVLAFLDGHQRVSRGCLDRCAELAVRRRAIVWPDVRSLRSQMWTGHGASMRLCPVRGYFSAEWHVRPSSSRVSKITTLRTPGYVMPVDVYRRVGWMRALRGWGASESAVALRAFFLDVDILHLCGPVARHKFRRKFPYATPWPAVWRNHALIARVCFDDRTWHEHWLPQVFQRYLTFETRRELQSDEVLQAHAAFQREKVRTDESFWNSVLGIDAPACLRPRKRGNHTMTLPDPTPSGRRDTHALATYLRLAAVLAVGLVVGYLLGIFASG